MFTDFSMGDLGYFFGYEGDQDSSYKHSNYSDVSQHPCYGLVLELAKTDASAYYQGILQPVGKDVVKTPKSEIESLVAGGLSLTDAYDSWAKTRLANEWALKNGKYYNLLQTNLQSGKCSNKSLPIEIKPPNEKFEHEVGTEKNDRNLPTEKYNFLKIAVIILIIVAIIFFGYKILFKNY